MSSSSSYIAGPKTARRIRSAGALAIPIFWALLIAVPLGYLVIISFRTAQQYAVDPLGLPSSWQIDNYARAWVDGHLAISFLNTAIVTVVGVVGVVALASAAAYTITRWVGRLGSGFYVLFALGLIVPFQLGLPTLYRMWAQLHLVNTLPGVILIHIGASLPLAVFLYCGFLQTVPRELEEAARIDGAGDVRTFVSVVFPLLRPVTATVAILSGIGMWNDLLLSIYFLQTPDKQTLPRATFAFSGIYQYDLPVIFACAVLTVIPILVLFIALQRFFLSGLSSGALKG